MTPTARIPALFAAGALCAAAIGCGGDDTGEPIPAGKAATMEQQLDAVQSAVDDARCEDIGLAVNTLQAEIGTLDSDGVGDDVQDALGDGADNLRSLATSRCERGAEEETETTPVEPVPSTPLPEPEPEPSVPEPEPEPEPSPEEEIPLPEEEEPDEGAGEGQFEPDGGGVGPPGQEKKEDGG